MQTSTLLLLAAFFSAAAADCRRDNCLRAVVASAFPSRPGTADCSSFLNIPVVTVTPSAVTSTVTNTNTVSYTKYVTNVPQRRRRAAFPGDTLFPITINEVRARAPASPTMPAYASGPCGGLISRYSSACSCLSITMSTTTAPTPTSTFTATQTTSTPVATVNVNMRFTQFDDNTGAQCDSPKSSPPPQTLYNEQCAFIPSGIKLTLTPFNVGSCVCSVNLSGNSDCSNPFRTASLNDFSGCLRSGGSGYLKLSCSSCP